MIKSREPNKFFIKQLVLSDDENPEVWTKEFYDELTKDTAIIGYFFNTTPGTSLLSEGKILNLYLIQRKYYKEKEVSRQELVDAWFNFLSKCKYEKGHKHMVFKNPPPKQWIDTKENWCKKMASKIVDQYNWAFDEALSEVYYVVLKCYAKEHVYMGNLGYIQTAITNSVLMCHRYNKNRINLSNPGRAVSTEEVIGHDNDGNPMLLEDILGTEDPWYAEEDARCFEEEVKRVLRRDFSDREIEQIINQPQKGYLPMNLYRRLLKWRKAHNVSEFTGDNYGKTK